MENLHQLNKEDSKTFILAGNAKVTIESGTSGVRYTYHVNKAKAKDLWFVGLLTGQDNDADYQYIGFFQADMKFRTSWKSKFTMDSAPSKAIAFTLDHINNIPEALHIYHSCHCGRCGRTLTTPESVKRGIGPECSTRI